MHKWCTFMYLVKLLARPHLITVVLKSIKRILIPYLYINLVNSRTNMIFTRFIVFVSCVIIVLSDSKMQPFIVGGHRAKIVDFPYSVHLGIQEDKVGTWMCGGSIINQYLTLTAAHCLYPCTQGSAISVSYGDENILKSHFTTARSYAIHQRYSDDSLLNDIALVRLNTPLSFNSKVSRVVLMENPPYKEEAAVAGWGVTDVSFQIGMI